MVFQRTPYRPSCDEYREIETAVAQGIVRWHYIHPEYCLEEKILAVYHLRNLEGNAWDDFFYTTYHDLQAGAWLDPYDDRWSLWDFAMRRVGSFFVNGTYDFLESLRP